MVRIGGLGGYVEVGRGFCRALCHLLWAENLRSMVIIEALGGYGEVGGGFCRVLCHFLSGYNRRDIICFGLKSPRYINSRGFITIYRVR